jgi:hypothetical protein
LSSWWWAVCRSKQVEQLRNTGIINSGIRLHLVGNFYMFYTECPTRYRTWHFFNNFTTNEDIATKFEGNLPHCVRNVKKNNVILFKFRRNIFISVRIIKEMPGSKASWTLCTMMHGSINIKAHRHICFSLPWCSYISIRVFIRRRFIIAAKSTFYLHHVRPPAWYQCGFNWTDFLKILYWGLLWKYVDEIQICLKRDKNIVILHKDHNMFHWCRGH